MASPLASSTVPRVSTSHGSSIILFGGPSSERLVSVASAQHISRVLPEARCWFWAPDGRVTEVSRESLQAHERPFERPFFPGSTGTLSPAAGSWPDCERAFDHCPADTVVILALHGSGGEDGHIQRILEDRRLCFTGSSAAASMLAFDKAAAKKVLRKNGIRVAESEVVSGQDLPGAERLLRALRDRTGRAVMKPVADGSSNGVCFIADEASIHTALGLLRKDPAVIYLGELFVQGTELTVGVHDTASGSRALPVSEVRMDAGRNFDYAGKYLGKGTVELTPAEIPDSVRDAAQHVALVAHRAIGCYGYSRTDMIVDSEGPVFLEINNLPGMTQASFIPQQLAAAGISMKDFLERQIELARTRFKDRT